ncbi:hypothetical protein CHL67_03810 [Prosthecochloris sp. GSB1]|uniref:hypothetical protein n=1 Tax=Prosthecochloris sp. GSB1 TaxID=281093 RepID=UPI000B8CEB54|nr:hypothetical protein [Prosthecochloris sp. GSB1]ASQ90171.1 hypothetical protein CHL67_03810 [Prosthecochloris sp. GSB1]
MNTSISSIANPGVDRSEALLELLCQITGKESSTIKGSLRGYYRAVPSLLGESFLGSLVSPSAFNTRFKARALSERIFLQAFEAISRWKSWNEPLANVLLREVVPALLGITSMQKRDNDPCFVGLALGRLAEQTGKGRIRLVSLVCPSYQYRRDANGRLWHASGELLPTTGSRFRTVAATLGRIFAPLAEHGVAIDWEFWGYTGETGDPEHLIDIARFVHEHYRADPRRLFDTLGRAAQDMSEQLREEMGRYAINASTGSLDRKFGTAIDDIRSSFSRTFPDQQENITRPKEVESWLNEVCNCGPLIHSFVEQENIYRQNVILEFSEPVVPAALREMLLYTHILDEVRKQGSVVIDTESSSNYMTETLRYLPAPLIFARSGKKAHHEGHGSYTMNIRQPYNIVPG